MPLSTIDSTPALVVVDLQSGILGGGYAGADVVLDKSVALADAFRAKGYAVVLVNVDAAPGGRSDQNPAGGARELPAEWCVIDPRLGQGDIVVTKKTRGAFATTDLDAQLKKLGVTQLFLTGIATGSGVEETGREGFALGYNIVTVTDAMLDSDPEIHEFVISKVFPKWSETTTSDDLLARL